MTTVFAEVRVEQSPDGAFGRQPNRFLTRFGDGPGEAPVEAAGTG
jgi:putative glutathione S-transferase